MKKINKVSTKKIKYEPIRPVCDVRIDDVNTDNDMVIELATAKINAGYNISVSELEAVIDRLSDEFNKVMTNMLNSYNKEEIENRCKICKLENDLKWATRPWYKKLMFWKKKPICSCLKAYC